MYQEKYSITWQTYSDHLKGMMKEFMMNEDFSDVTLVSEDKKQIKANINILSLCSPFFNDFLKKDKNFSPIMYLRGVQYSELESIMQFIYLGEATFYEDRMEEFLAVAKSLEIKQLCDFESNNKIQPNIHPSQNDQDNLIELVEDQADISDNEIEEVMGKNEYDQCHMNLNKRAQVHEGVKYECDHCDYQTSTQLHYFTHIQSKHDGIKYDCDQCDYKATSKLNISRHIQSKHEGIKYNCDQCNYKATRKDNLVTHKQSKHEGIKYNCDQCDYQAARKDNLVIHKQSVHEGVKYGCVHCDHQYKYKSDLNKHIQSKHKVFKFA